MPIQYQHVSEQEAKIAEARVLPKGEHVLSTKGIVKRGQFDYRMEIKPFADTIEGREIQKLVLPLEYNGEYGHRTFVDYVPLEGKYAYKMRSLAKACGVLDLYEAKTLELYHLTDKKVLSTIGHRDSQKDGKSYTNEVFYSYHEVPNGFEEKTAGGASRSSAPAAQSDSYAHATQDAPFEDSIPF